MSTLWILLLVITIIACVSLYVYDNWFRQRKLDYFGIGNVQRVLKWESPEQRGQIFDRGWMTSAQWTYFNKKQQADIEAEIQRRKL
jgi:hypothetical protein